MQERASCRSFTSQPIPADLMEKLLKTGLRAASAGNLQPYSILLLDPPEQNGKLAALCPKMKFVAQAPVNLLFLLDWHKLHRYAEMEDAPFTSQKSFLPFVMGIADLTCVAQTIETAAHLFGIGSCYVGNVNHFGEQIIQEFHLPCECYPVLGLSLGYPATNLKQSRRLPYDMMVFRGDYPALSQEQIAKAYQEKYGDCRMHVTRTEPYHGQIIESIREALLTTYSSGQTEQILARICKTNELSEIQRRFAVKYHAKHHLELGRLVMELYEKQGISPFSKETP